MPLSSLPSLGTDRMQTLTHRELLYLHAEVKTLQDQYGISYKDAAHRLYHAEILKVSGLVESRQVLSKIHTEVDIAIAEAIEQGPKDVAEDGGNVDTRAF